MKRTLLLAILLCFQVVSSAHSQLSNVVQTKIADDCRQQMGLEATVLKIKAGEVDSKLLAILRAVLSATQEQYIHQQRGATENKIYVSPDGLQEAVYGADGQLVLNGINDGSFNYFHPVDDPMRHYFFDTHPWIRFGNTRTDPTTPNERLSAYMADLDVGIVKAARAGDFPAIDLLSLRVGEPEAYAIFLSASDDNTAEALFRAIESREILQDDVRIKLLRKVELDLQQFYSK